MLVNNESTFVKRSCLVLVALSALVGIYLRVVGIGDQVVYDDELHAVGLAVTHSYFFLASYFFSADACIPLTLLTKVFGDTIGISELTLRLPVVVAGLGSLLILPMLVWKRLGPTATVAFTGLLAISPYLIYYSRYARPYGISALLATVATFAFYEWMEGRERRYAVIYGICAVLATYFHLLASLMAVVAPFTFAGLQLLGPWRKRWKVKLPEVMLVGCLTTIAIAALLAPAFLETPDSMLGKAGRDSVNLQTIISTLHILSGTSSVWGMTIFWSLAGLGTVLALWFLPAFALLCLLAVAVQLIGVAILGPSLVQISIVYARYCVFALPLVLVFFSVPFAAMAGSESGAVRATGSTLLAIGATAILFHAGPLPRAYSGKSNFTNHTELIPIGQPDRHAEPEEFSPFYANLAESTDDFDIIEAPWYSHWQGNSFGFSQSFHRKGVFIGLIEPADGEIWTIYNFPTRNPMLSFERFVDLHDPKAIAASGARYLVLHRDLAREIGPVASRGASSPPVDKVLELHRERFGPEIYEDDLLSVFKLR